ncbi:ImmA/IrrE family metallo-endopeptidase [uncultured Clostridium sp.]|uniref:ImmA/IrrE family metallo-endopeptidase n=1 Tax=uncultured Clostridium sp. TaxID=59620 RepID=UPI002601FF74|nr:ImmA/IrrE family metallo-endopeptidase [uncultured Clostridium sp.]
MDYNTLLFESDNMNVIIRELDLKTKEGLCFGNRIAINTNLSTIKKGCVLAEELGHCLLTVGDILDQSNLTNRKQENLARSWSYEKMIPLTSIINAHKYGVTDKFELAEFLNVTVDFLQESMKHYYCKYGLSTRYNNFIIKFSPLNVLKIS